MACNPSLVKSYYDVLLYVGIRVIPEKKFWSCFFNIKKWTLSIMLVALQNQSIFTNMTHSPKGRLLSICSATKVK